MKKRVWAAAFAAAGGVLSVYGYSDKLPTTTGTNVWIGAASGGNWSDAANWKCESATYTDPIEMMQKGVCYFVFTNLTDGAEIVQDYHGGTTAFNTSSLGASDLDASTNCIACSGFRFDIPSEAKVTLKTASNTIKSANSFLAGPDKGYGVSGGSTFTVNGGTLDFGCFFFKSGNEPWCPGPHFDGTGKIRFTNPELYLWQAGMFYHGNLTAAFTNNVNNLRCTLLTAYDKARLVIEPGPEVKVRGISGTSGKTGEEPVVEVLAGARLHLGTGFNSGAGKYNGKIEGAGEIHASGGAKFKLYKGVTTGLADFTGLFSWYYADFDIGTIAEPQDIDPAVALEAQNGGYFRYWGQDLTVATLGGDGAGGAILPATNKVFTVGGRTDNAATTTVYKAKIVGQPTKFVKDGANYTLALSGQNEYNGATEVRAGTLELRRPGDRGDADAWWSFDAATSGEYDGTDCSDNGSLALEPWTTNPSGAHDLPTTVADGVQGRAIHFNGNKFASSSTDSFALYTGSKSLAHLPSGNEPFTVRFWFRTSEEDSNSNCYLFTRRAEGAWSSLEQINFSSDDNMKTFCMWSCGWTRSGFGSDGKRLDNNVRAVMDNHLNDGKWHQVVGTYANRSMSLYIDGEHKETRTTTGDMNISASKPVWLNYCTSSDHRFTGDMDEVAYLRGAWTAEEVARDWRTRSAPVAAVEIPEPVAHWDFNSQITEDGKTYFPDVSPKGLHWDLESCTTSKTYITWSNMNYPEPGGKFVQLKDNTGAYLKLKDGVDIASQFGSGNVSVTISMYVGRAMASGYPFVFGDPSNSKKLFAESYEGCPRLIGAIAGGSRYSLSDAFQCAEINNSSYGAEWTLFTIAYDADSGYLSVYRDGIRVRHDQLTKANVQFNPLGLWIGKYNTTYYGNNHSYADIRIWNQALTPAQVRAFAGALRHGGYTQGPVLPTNTIVSVAAGATLRANGGVQTVSKVTGAGTLDARRGHFAVADLSEFTGTVCGDSGVFLLSEGQRLANAGNTADFGFVDGVIALSPAAAATPFVQTTGKFVLPTDGTVKVPGGKAFDLLGKTFAIAECSAYEGPVDTTGWTFDATGADALNLHGKFKFANGKLTLRMSGGGMMLLVK